MSGWVNTGIGSMGGKEWLGWRGLWGVGDGDADGVFFYDVRMVRLRSGCNGYDF